MTVRFFLNPFDLANNSLYLYFKMLTIIKDWFSCGSFLGFMKKAFRDALESEGVILEKRKGKEQTDEQKHLEVTQAQSASPISQSVPTSPRQPRSNALERCSSDQMLLQVEPSTTKDSHHSGSGHLQRKTLSSPVLTSDSVEKKFLSNLKVNTEKEAEIIVQRGRSVDRKNLTMNMCSLFVKNRAFFSKFDLGLDVPNKHAAL